MNFGNSYCLYPAIVPYQVLYIFFLLYYNTGISAPLPHFILLNPSTVHCHYTCPLSMLMLSAGSVSVMSARLAKFAGASSIQLSTAKAL